MEHRDADYTWESDYGAEKKFFFEQAHDMSVDEQRKAVRFYNPFVIYSKTTGCTNSLPVVPTQFVCRFNTAMKYREAAIYGNPTTAQKRGSFSSKLMIWVLMNNEKRYVSTISCHFS